MGREVKQVALDFSWPLGEVWSGYVRPDEGESSTCSACEGSGSSPRARHLMDRWYGNVAFDPTETGSVAFAPTHEAVLWMARRNLEHSPGFYGRGEAALAREALRLATLYNRCWSHHLCDAEVAALVKAGRLREFTHDWDGSAWQPKRPAVTPSAAQINAWSLCGFGHDSINAHVCVRAACEREGVSSVCAVCEGEGVIWESAGAKATAEAWVRTEPPAGAGWQLWETVSAGAPVTPVFSSADALIDYLVEGGDLHDRENGAGGWRREAAEDLIESGSAPTLLSIRTAEGVTLLMPRDGDFPNTL